MVVPIRLDGRSYRICASLPPFRTGRQITGARCLCEQCRSVSVLCGGRGGVAIYELAARQLPSRIAAWVRITIVLRPGGSDQCNSISTDSEPATRRSQSRPNSTIERVLHGYVQSLSSLRAVCVAGVAG